MMTVDLCALSDRGLVRPTNQDHYPAAPGPKTPGLSPGRRPRSG
jgi:hypothetical protein